MNKEVPDELTQQFTRNEKVAKATLFDRKKYNKQY